MKNNRESEHIRTVKRVIKNDNSENAALIKAQNKYLKELKAMLKDQRSGKNVDVSEIRNSLQKRGIIDKNGNLAELYTTGRKPEGKC